MAKLIRIRTNGILTFEGTNAFELEQVEGQVTVWFHANGPVCLWGNFTDGVTIPLHVGTQLDQVYHFEENIKNLVVAAPAKTAYAIRVLQYASRYKDPADPVPHRAIAPLDNLSDTMENRVIRAVDAALSARGLSSGRHKGVEYSEEDTEFGPGYQYDEDAEDEIQAAAERAVAERLKPKKPAVEEPAPVVPSKPATTPPQEPGQ